MDNLSEFYWSSDRSQTESLREFFHAWQFLVKLIVAVSAYLLSEMERATVAQMVEQLIRNQ